MTAPRITLEDGASFNGRIDMQPKGAGAKSSRTNDTAERILGSGDIKAVGE